MNGGHRALVSGEGRTLVVGVGNTLRGDDAAGVEVARLVVECDACEVIIAEDVPENYLGPMEEAGAQTVIFCDAVDLQAEPGTTAILDLDKMQGPSVSTHNASLRLVGKCLRESGVERILIAAIQPQSMEWGAEMSEVVKSAVVRLADELCAIMKPGVGPEQ